MQCEFNLTTLKCPVKLECVFETSFPYHSGACSGENLIAMSHVSNNFALAVGFECDFPHVLPEYVNNCLLLNILDEDIEKIICRIAWLICQESESRNTGVELAVDNY